MPYLWSDEAWEDYQYWLSQDKKTLKRVNSLLKEIARGDGKPHDKAEILKGTDGLRSVRVDQKNRLVYKVEGDVVRVVSVKGHYSDR